MRRSGWHLSSEPRPVVGEGRFNMDWMLEVISREGRKEGNKVGRRGEEGGLPRSCCSIREKAGSFIPANVCPWVVVVAWLGLIHTPQPPELCFSLPLTSQVVGVQCCRHVWIYTLCIPYVLLSHRMSSFVPDSVPRLVLTYW